MLAKNHRLFVFLTLLLAGSIFALDCPADSSYHVDIRTMLPDGSPNPSYGQVIATGLCACIGFVEYMEQPSDTTIALTLRIVDNEPIRGIEIDLYHDAGSALVYNGMGSVAKGAKLLNVTDPDGNPKTMTLLANEITNHVKVMAYSTSQAQTAGNGEEDNLFTITYGVPGGVTSLPDYINFGIGICNVPGTSMAPQLLNVVCSFPDTLNPVAVSTASVGIADANTLPTTFELAQNYPNPFNPTTRIAFAIPKTGQVSIYIYNLIGQRVATLLNDNLSAGRYEVNWNGMDTYNNAVASGMYFYELRADNFVSRKKMVLLR